MNLHGIAAPYIGVVNPLVPATVKRSTGYTTLASGKRVPLYTTFGIICQVQPLSNSDLRQLDGLNIQTVTRAVYFTGNTMAVVRVDSRGGDLIVFAPGVLPEGTTWKAVRVLEPWPDWVKVGLALQDPDEDGDLV